MAWSPSRHRGRATSSGLQTVPSQFEHLGPLSEWSHISVRRMIMPPSPVSLSVSAGSCVDTYHRNPFLFRVDRHV